MDFQNFNMNILQMASGRVKFYRKNRKNIEYFKFFDQRKLITQLKHNLSSKKKNLSP